MEDNEMTIASLRCLVAAVSLCLLAPAVVHAGASRASADSMQVRVVPNPWSAADAASRWGGRPKNPLDDGIDYSRVTFFNIPVRCTINIYTIDGDLVRSIDHEPIGDIESQQQRWDLVTRSSQAAVSGIYVFAVTNKEDGATQVGKLIIIR
jgi:hypothetical protein